MQSPRITRLLTDPSPQAVDDFWREVTAAGAPLVEPWDDDCVLVTFLWRGEARSTRAWWGVDVPLSRVPGTDLWHGTELLPADLRTVYCLAHDDTEELPAGPDGSGPSHLDTANPRRLLLPGDPQDRTDHDEWASVLELPRAPADPWTDPRPGVPAGQVTATGVPSAALGGVRPVAVYRPAGVVTTDLPVLVVFDGFPARTVLRIPTVLDNLIAAGRIPPLCALFVSNFRADRETELSPVPAIADFVVHELMPWARDTLGTSSAPGVNLISGASRGGLVAVHLGLRAPEVFGAVVAQSGSFWWPAPTEGRPEWLIREVARRPRADVRFALSVGRLETMPGPGGAPSQIAVNRRMRDALRSRGYQVDYAEYAGGHDCLNWRRTFADGLLAVAGRTPALSG
ncbi:alpha/beta hydrolase-fold protein [Micromonosporaceae bacterium Da 78-11]